MMRDERQTQSRHPGRTLYLFASAFAFASVFGASACSDGAVPNASAQTEDRPASDAAPKTVVAVVDFSGSQPSHSASDARAYLEKVVEGLNYGDRFVLLEMYRTGSRDSVGRFVQDMPEVRTPGRETSLDRRGLDAARRGVLNALPVFFDPELVGSIGTTDLFTTLHIASEHLRDARGDRQLLLLSDMYQSTSDWEFERARRMPGQDWVEQQAQSGLVPALDDACVVVIGADPTTTEGQRVRRFWDEYLGAAGAELEAYRVRAPTSVLEC